jgi:FMN phosphatase YigB (HAD superfamily)
MKDRTCISTPGDLPLVIDTESTIFFDVDDTLVMWGKEENRIEVKEPYYGEPTFVTPHKGHIKILKDRKARGSFIVVWSAGGYRWAAAVIKALKLEEYVDLVMTKPHAYVDDKQPNEIMGERIYLPYGGGYGE